MTMENTHVQQERQSRNGGNFHCHVSLHSWLFPVGCHIDSRASGEFKTALTIRNGWSMVSDTPLRITINDVASYQILE